MVGGVFVLLLWLKSNDVVSDVASTAAQTKHAPAAETEARHLFFYYKQWD